MSQNTAPKVPFRQQLKRRCASVYRHLHPRRRAGDLVILNYHSIQPDEPYSNSPEAFAQHLEWLSEHYRLLSLSAWLDEVARGFRDPRPAALVSFDDGYENFYQFAYPVLQRLRAPSLLFVTTGFIDGGCGVEERLAMYRGLRPLSWAQLQEVHRNGVTVGSHTHRHLNLGQATPDQVAEELRRSKLLLEDRLGSPVPYFAYPWGQRRNIGRATIPLLRECGYSAACCTLWGKNTAATEPYLLRRVRIDPWDTLEDVRDKTEGDWDFVGLYHMVR